MFQPPPLKMNADITLLNTGLNYLQYYPDTELYRLLVDGSLHHSEIGWLGYENREKNSIKAGLTGIAVALENIEIQLVDIDLIKRIHAACTRDVKKLVTANKPGELRDKNDKVQFGFKRGGMTSDGFLEILNHIEANINSNLKKITFYYIRRKLVPFLQDFLIRLS